MVVLLHVEDREPHHGVVDEGLTGARIGQALEIGVGVEFKLVLADPGVGGRHHRSVGAPVGVGCHRPDDAPRVALLHREFDGDALGGAPAIGVEDVRADPGHAGLRSDDGSEEGRRAGSAAAVVGVAPGREQDRQVVALGHVADDEAHRHLAQEVRGRQLDAERLEIGVEVHQQLVAAGFERLVDEQWVRGAAGGRGRHRLDEAVAVAFADRQVADHAGAGGAVEVVDRVHR